MKRAFAWSVAVLLAVLSSIAQGQRPMVRPIVIAHRGASGYLPEHTLPAKALAYGMGADFLEQDIVLTRDDQPIVLHDIHLDAVTNVADVFPDRARTDGRYYAIDFMLAEIKQLKVSERIDLQTGQAVFPGRFPVGKSDFRIPSLAEELQLVQGLNQTLARQVGIYPEIKSPAWHRKEGKDISRIVLKVLQDFRYDGPEDRVFLQCFDADEARRMRSELKTQLPIVQLIGDNDGQEAPTDFDQLRTPEGLESIAEYAVGIGPSIDHVLELNPGTGEPQLTGLVELAHRNNLVVHPYTLRADKLPDYAATSDDLMKLLFQKAEVDGVFTDFPDQAVQFLARWQWE